MSCLKGVKDPFGAQERRCDFLKDAAAEKKPQLALRGESPGFSRVSAGFLSSYNGDFRDPLVGPQGLSGPRSSSFVEAGNSRFLSRADMDLGVPLGRPQGSQGLVSYGAMQDRSPLDLEKQCEFSCLVHHSDRWLSL